MVKILIDRPEENNVFSFPTLVVGKSRMVHVHPGKSIDDPDFDVKNTRCLFVADRDYDEIDYRKPLVLFHDLDVEFEEALKVVANIESENAPPTEGDQIHYHVNVNFRFEKIEEWRPNNHTA